MSGDNEPITFVTCIRCNGDGARREVVEGAGRYRVSGEQRCWLCKGLGSLPPQILGRWILAGRPIDEDLTF